ncbi:AraC family transcriptional regulator [Enorma burkinafasonensis]|uniref:AraC family transcriptional regulator n=1 Tax=Enorma burkinafasonensis TaxID=2590867 RepID=UPI0011A0C216|nr:AraC family transcriptional regulator [Enorma burkinafasonensis]
MRPHEIEFSTFDGGIYTDLTPYQYGREVCTPGHAFGPARRGHYLFHYVLDGCGTLTASGAEDAEPATFEVSAGEGFLIFPGQVTTYVADLKTPWEYIWVEFDGSHVKSLLDRTGLSPAYPIYRSRDDGKARQMVDAMRSLLDHRAESPVYLVGCTYFFFEAFLSSVEPHRSQAPNKLHDFYVDHALNFIEENYRDNVGVEDIARSVGLNRSYFGKVFREAMGVSPQQFLIGYRMEKACELLKLSTLSIAQVGREVGYPNQLHFSRAFRNAVGISPRAWRQQNTTR